MDLISYVRNNLGELEAQLLDQVVIVAVSMVVAGVIGVALGAAAARFDRLRGAVLGVAAVAITLPSFALFTALSYFLGIGDAPVEVGLIIYALLPLVRNTVVGLRGVDPAVIDAAAGMGMTATQTLRRVQVPLALPLIIAGFRQATVMVVAIATVGATVGANDLGQPILAGIRDSSSAEVFAGVIPAALLALLADRLLGVAEGSLSRRSRVAAAP
ncbi:MAG: ABC transporter permease [Candidatus Dormibacteria bacterium]